jgi:hypothetical protein
MIRTPKVFRLLGCVSHYLDQKYPGIRENEYEMADGWKKEEK